MQYEQVYQIVDKIFAQYRAEFANANTDHKEVLASLIDCATLAEAEGYDDETIVAAFLPDIAYVIESQRQFSAPGSIFCKESLLRRHRQLLKWAGKPRAAVKQLCDMEISRVKEIITRYLISLIEAPAKAYV
ncbi:MAG: hypothetical protein JSS82_05790 [Bacteroidetes bacterium]|nr:hypothetical protein [Bacteroidota bacterium]